MSKKYQVAGLMSGTSLDGLDIAVCEFTEHNGKWSYQLLAAETIEYEQAWRRKLLGAMHCSGIELVNLDIAFGDYCGEQLKQFLGRHQLTVQFASSHGHTIFHNPKGGYTYQIGQGSWMAAASGVPVICDFRTLDVACGGEGAPLVPIGDKLLFSDFTFCLNLGGIANISFDKEGKRLAFDVCPLNLILNDITEKEFHLPYDPDGRLSSQGNVHFGLLDELNQLDFYDAPYPKSLGREWVETKFQPILKQYSVSPQDALATLCEHMATQIARCLEESGLQGKVLVTGGGAFHMHLIQRIKSIAHSFEIIVPEKELVLFKEAVIFAFLGLLRAREEKNCLSSVTGAQIDVCGGAIYLPPNWPRKK